MIVYKSRMIKFLVKDPSTLRMAFKHLFGILALRMFQIFYISKVFKLIESLTNLQR